MQLVAQKDVRLTTKTTENAVSRADKSSLMIALVSIPIFFIPAAAVISPSCNPSSREPRTYRPIGCLNIWPQTNWPDSSITDFKSDEKTPSSVHLRSDSGYSVEKWLRGIHVIR